MNIYKRGKTANNPIPKAKNKPPIFLVIKNDLKTIPTIKNKGPIAIAIVTKNQYWAFRLN